MAVETTIAFAALLLEDKHLVALHEGLEHFAAHTGAFHCGGTYFHCTVGVYEENFVEADGLSLLNLFAEMMNIQKLAFFGLELLSFNFYNSVHANFLIIK